jgi:hypothetical protein
LIQRVYSSSRGAPFQAKLRSLQAAGFLAVARLRATNGKRIWVDE